MRDPRVAALDVLLSAMGRLREGSRMTNLNRTLLKVDRDFVKIPGKTLECVSIVAGIEIACETARSFGLFAIMRR